MADVDPEKIIAELEAARALAQKPRREDLEPRLKMLIISIVAVVVLAAGALWALDLILENMSRPSKNGHKSPEVQTVR